MTAIGRNDPCPCGSGRKYKHCCRQREESPLPGRPGVAAPASLQIPTAIRTAMEHQQAGRLPQAEAIYRQILQVNPNHPDALHWLGVLAYQTGKYDIAVELITRGIDGKPSDPTYHINLGSALERQGKMQDAIASYRKALSLRPDHPQAHSNLGGLYQAEGRLDEAVASYRRALASRPDHAQAHYSLGRALQAQGKPDEALACYRRALALKPDYPEALNSMGGALQAQGKLDEAVSSYRKALLLKPDHAKAHSNLGNALKDQGRLDEAAASHRRALEIEPGFPEAHNNLGGVLQSQGNLDAAVASYRNAIALNPGFAEAHNNLGVALLALGRLVEAVSSYRHALTLRPGFAEAHNNLGSALRDQGRRDEAAACYRNALALRPDYAAAYSNLLFLYGYQSILDPGEYLRLACGWERACVPAKARQTAARRTIQRPPPAGRRLKIGYVSGDYRRHAVGYFLKNIFSSHDRTRMELYAYSTLGTRDSVTEEYAALVDHWVPLSGLADAAAADRIGADGIDVLIDLSGHTAHNRLGVFALRAAPVQAHYLGYFASTGLSEMDYWIGDEVLTPPETDGHFAERVWRLPRVWVGYEGNPDAPLPDWRPDPSGVVWLGSFNNLNKVTAATLALWAKVLHALPEGRLLLKANELADDGNRRRILDAMAGHGIAAARIELQDSSLTPAWSSHMAYYNRLDIALDPVGGLGGGTTTCDALWMAVPLVTLIGNRMASRMTASMLHAIGHPEWVARSDADYIDTLVALARNVDLRRRLRADQRLRVARSPLCDARSLATALEDAYCEMFRRRRDGSATGMGP